MAKVQRKKVVLVLCTLATFALATGQQQGRLFGVEQCPLCDGEACGSECFRTCSVSGLSLNATSGGGGAVALRRGYPHQNNWAMFQDKQTITTRGEVVLDEELFFSVTIQNSADTDQVGVEVAVVARQWGLSFDSSRAWPQPGYWTPSKCPSAKEQDLEWATKLKCPNNCTGRGVCQFGRCFCAQGTSSVVGTSTVTVPAHSSVVVTIPHTFDSRAYTGLEFRVNGGMLVTPCPAGRVRCPQGFCVSSLDLCKYGSGPGKAQTPCDDSKPLRCADGQCVATTSECSSVEILDAVDQAAMLETDAPLGPESEAGLATNVGCVDRTQTNGDIVYSGENASYRLPIVNDQNEEVAMRLSTRCRINAETPGACSNVRVYAPGMDSETGVVIIPPNTEVEAEIQGTEMAGTVEVEVFAQDVQSGLVESASLQFVVTNLEELINSPLLCCIRSIKVRVMLESLLVLLLLLVERGELEKAMTVALKFIGTVKQLLCDGFSFEEKRCLERAMLTILDTARMMAAQVGLDEELARSATAPTRIRRQSMRGAVAAVREGDELRRQGMLEEAVLMYRKAPQAVRRDSLRAAGRAGTGRRVSMSTMLSTAAAAGNEEVWSNHPTQLFAHNVQQTET